MELSIVNKEELDSNINPLQSGTTQEHIMRSYRSILILGSEINDLRRLIVLLFYMLCGLYALKLNEVFETFIFTYAFFSIMSIMFVFSIYETIKKRKAKRDEQRSALGDNLDN